MNSKSITWVIEYKIIGNDNIKAMEINLYFNKVNNVKRWFNSSNHRKNFEFVNAKIKE